MQSTSTTVATQLVGMLLSVRTVIRMQWRLIAAITVSVVALTIVAVLLMPRLYKSDASFTVDSDLASLAPASVLGLLGSIGGSLGGEQSPAFYVKLIESRPILNQLLLTRPSHACAGGPSASSYLQRLKIEGESQADSLYSGRRLLLERLTADYQLETGIVEVTLEAECPLLAQELLDSLLAALNTFNVETRQSRAKARRLFAEDRVQDADQRLRAAEYELEQFLTTNRTIGSPTLQFMMERLERRVNMQAELAAALRREFESARLEEVNSTPSLTILAPPSLPLEPSRPRRRLAVLVALLLGLPLAFTVGAMRTLIQPLPVNAPAYLVHLKGRLGLPLATSH